MKRGIRIAGILLLCAAFACGGYFAGRITASHPEEENPDYMDGFSAVVLENDSDGKLMVDGLETNNVNFRGEMYLSLNDAQILQNGVMISRDALHEGDTILVLHTGRVAEIYPPIVEDVTLIIKMQDADQQ